MARTARIERTTKETEIVVEVELDGTGQAQIETGIGFLDHMLTLLARHAALDLRVAAGAICTWTSTTPSRTWASASAERCSRRSGDKSGIRRYGHCTLPMEETLVTAAIDLSGRSYFVFQAEFPSPKIGDFDSELVEDFWQAAAANALCNLHVLLHYGRNSHHISEAIFKAVARALRAAVERDPRAAGVPSTKGTLERLRLRVAFARAEFIPAGWTKVHPT